MDSVAITGVSTGIGRATARELVTRGFRVFGSVRRQTDADRLSQDLGPNFVPLTFDVTDKASVATAAENVSALLDGATLFGLVNNAGVAVPGPLLELSIDELRRQLEVNLVGQLTVIQQFAPILGVDRSRTGRPGRIVMVSSTGGKRAFPFMGPYAASKFALEGLSESLRRELMLFGIDVIVVAPGPTVTAIWDKAEAVDLTSFAGSPFAPALGKFRQFMLTEGKKGLAPERVGRVIADALVKKRPKTRYTVTPMPILNQLLNRLPKRLVDRMLARRLGLTATTGS
jgi:NAD(P)-dependent dehydrogenase (short-subunit alcohol dehydrogenase family)